MEVHVSLTPADPLRIGEAARVAERAGASALHVDLGDGHFTPWLGGSVELVRALAELRSLPVGVHLMVAEPEPLIAPLADAGARWVTVHIEAAPYPWRLRALCRRLGVEFGLALNPATPPTGLEMLRECADFVSLLTTEPDGEGERLLPGMAERVAAARTLLGREARIEVDGGIGLDSAGSMAAVGADRVVVGRAVLASPDPGAAVAAMALAVSTRR